MTMICIQAIISGKVQGVFYRDKTRHQANTLQLTGWVKNRPDGKVELVACGKKNQVEAFVDWLWEGPKAADVTDVQYKEISMCDCKEFDIRYES